MPVVIWTTVASQDIRRHFDFLRVRNSDAAKRAVSAILEAGGSLELNLYRGPIIHEPTGLRKLIVSFGKYGFIIHYQISDGESSVVIESGLSRS